MSRWTIRFGVFEFDGKTRELHKDGRKIRLQDQPAQILETLLDRPGELVSREAFGARLWPEGTHLDRENSLATAMAKLRAALDDPAKASRLIETLPKRGYRFIGEVTADDVTLRSPEPVARHKKPVHRVTRPVLSILNSIAVHETVGKEGHSSLEQEVESLRRRVDELEVAAANRSFDAQWNRKVTTDLKRSFDEAPIGLCYLDTDLRYVHINKWLARINGQPAEAHLGKTIGEAIPDVAVGVERQLREVLATGQPVIAGRVNAETPAHLGIKHDYEHFYYADLDPDGTPSGISCVVLDVTERVRNELLLRIWTQILAEGMSVDGQWK